MPKTASRTFQYHYFTPHDEIRHVGKKKPDPSDLEWEFPEIITDMERLEFRANRERITQRYIEELFDQEHKYVVSAESFSVGSSLSGKVDRYTIANRLHDIFPSGQVVIVLRNQLDVIRSLYRQRLKLNPNIDSFKDWIAAKRERSYRTTLFDYFDYDELIGMYEDRFGYENVHVLFFEQLLRDQTEFVESLSDVLGIKSRPELIEGAHENPSLTNITLLWQKAQNNVSALSVLPELLPENVKSRIKKSGSKIEVSYTDDQREYLTRRFAESNETLRSDRDLPLETYGYPL